ncbi:MAG: hypothetical protein AB8I08_23310 [Sandaracinaceae bacterium]
MDGRTRALADLLARERAAALDADLDALEAIQDEKRALFEEVGSFTDGPAFQHLSQVARANVGLIRQLVALHRALAGVDAVGGGYGSDGREQYGARPAFVRRVL